MGLSNYPPGFGGAGDLDNVYGPIDETSIDDHCPECGNELMQSVYRTTTMINCIECLYYREIYTYEDERPEY